ncbi:hypothetical protein J6590_064149, partial [Homalodisca vitripennis]
APDLSSRPSHSLRSFKKPLYRKASDDAAVPNIALTSPTLRYSSTSAPNIDLLSEAAQRIVTSTVLYNSGQQVSCSLKSGPDTGALPTRTVTGFPDLPLPDGKVTRRV